MEAIRTLIRWAGDDPSREGLLGTPERVVRSYREFFSGYDEDPVALLQRTFEETDGYDEIVALKDIRFDRTASTISRRSSARFISPICPISGSSASRSSPGSSMSSPSVCRSRKR